MNIRNLVGLPVTNQGYRRLELGIVAIGVVIAFLAVCHQWQMNPRPPVESLDRDGLTHLIEKILGDP